MIARYGCYFQSSVRRERSWISGGIHSPPATGSLQPEAIGAACGGNETAEAFEGGKGVRNEWHSEIHKLLLELGIDRCRPSLVKNW